MNMNLAIQLLEISKEKSAQILLQMEAMNSTDRDGMESMKESVRQFHKAVNILKAHEANPTQTKNPASIKPVSFDPTNDPHWLEKAIAGFDPSTEKNPFETNEAEACEREAQGLAGQVSGSEAAFPGHGEVQGVPEAGENRGDAQLPPPQGQEDA